MNKKRFMVRTFRGYLEADDYESAYCSAKSMIADIKQDGWCDEYWWAEINDQFQARSRLVWLRGNYAYQITQWLHLR